MDDSDDEEVAETKAPAPKAKAPSKPCVARHAFIIPVLVANIPSMRLKTT